jgi:glycosyltransferase involved in cell wall biosynthesis
MKIALLTDGIYPYVLGGMQMHSWHLARSLVQAGVSVELYHYIPKGKEDIPLPFTAEELVHLHITTVEYPPTGRLPGHYIRERYHYSKRLLAAFKERAVDVDFIYAQGLTGRAFIDAKKSGTPLPPIGINVHGYEMFQWAANWKETLQHVLLRPAFAHITRQADFVFSFSGKIREIVEQRLGVPSDRIIEVPNAIDASWIVDAPARHDGPLRFVFVGRYERRKGIEELHQVITEIDPETCEFHFIGPIPEDVQLKRSNVIYHGRVMESERMQQLLDQCDVLLCPSYAEGMPTVILEAMARGLAVIATDVGATSSMVSSDNGILLSAPSIVDLRDAIKTMLNQSGAEVFNLKEQSLSAVRQFTWARVARETIDEIRSRVSQNIL